MRRRLPGAFADLPAALRRDLVDPAQQFLGAAARTAVEVTTGTPSSADSLSQIDVDAAPARDVDHVEHEQHRPADALQFDHQAQRHPQIGGVGDAQQQVGRALAGECGRARRRG